MVCKIYSYRCFVSWHAFMQALTYVCSMTYLFASPNGLFLSQTHPLLIRFTQKIPDPILGPKKVRLLLLLRGVAGSAISDPLNTLQSWLIDRFCRFFGLFGIYYSLQYLSMSDATVLTFLSPMCTAMAGAFFLGENFTCREALAGHKWILSWRKLTQKFISHQSG